MTPDIHVELRGIHKRFFAVHALADIHLSVARGTIHALVGENGAGKSTLGKIISGVIRPDEGEFLVDGRPVHYASPRDALADGITTISQELTLVPRRSVLDNVFLGIESQRGGILQTREMRRQFEALTARSGFTLDPDALVADLRHADKKKVEILRAIARNSRLIIMDEPTAALATDETAKLLEIVRGLRRAGTTIVYVSHFLSEVLSLADTVTVLRNGTLVRTAPAVAETPETLVEAMLGRPVSLAFPPRQPVPPQAPVVVQVEGFGRERAFADVSFSIRAGEIVGLAGLVGSGRSEVARAIFGADRRDCGVLRLNGEPIQIRGPQDAVRAGIAMLPESRKLQGLVMTLPVGHNVTLPHLAAVSRGTVIRSRQEASALTRLLTQLDVRPPNWRIPVHGLSGGNQQKVLFAKWLFRRPRLLLADEPTAGVDVGAKQAVYELIAGLAREGLAVLLISSELEEVLGLAHRVLVMRLGRIVAELEGDSLTMDAVIHAAFATEKGGGDLR